LSSLQLENVSVFLGGKYVISDLSFSINAPAFMALVGNNGSGKTTLLRTILSKLDHEGNIFINGQKLNHHKSDALKYAIAMLGQKNMIQFSIPVIELVVMGRFHHQKTFFRYSETDYEKARQYLEHLNILSLHDKNYLELSGGEQQLVWLAQVLVQEADIILLDEPTQYLDVANRKRVFDLLLKIAAEERKIIICATHEIDYLKGVKTGLVLNLSEKKCQVETITEQIINKHLALLEQA
jgi:iron complex transport system ATP-binding protein